MHDEARMRMLNAGTDGEEEIDALIDGEVPLSTVFGNRLAFDVFEYEIWVACFCSAAIQQSGNIRMREEREQLAFISQTAEQFVRIESTANDFDCDLLLKVIVA